MQKSNYTILLFVIAIISAMVLPTLFMDGMFTDGILYAAVSKNLAHGIGNFWDPHFSAFMHPHFHEQPPLMFFLQGIFFRIFGDGFITERIYSTVLIILSAFLMARIWKRIFPENNLFWLPFLLWFAIPQTLSSFVNNLEECTMIVFTLATILHMIIAFQKPNSKYYHFLIAGFFLVCTGMTKGPQGLFLITSPFFFWLFFKNYSFFKMMITSFIVSSVLLLFIFFVILYEPARNSFVEYFHSRLTVTFAHFHDTTSSHLYLLDQLLINLAPAALISFLFYLSGRKKGPLLQIEFANFFLCCGIAGSFPLMITLEQRPFYLATSLPFFAFALSIYAQHGAKRMTELIYTFSKIQIGVRIISLFVILFVIISVIYISNKHIIKRDEATINELAMVASVTGENSEITISTTLYTNWSLTNYANRYHGLSLTTNDNEAIKWHLFAKSDFVSSKNLRRMPISSQMTKFNLFEAFP